MGKRPTLNYVPRSQSKEPEAVAAPEEEEKKAEPRSLNKKTPAPRTVRAPSVRKPNNDDLKL